MDPNRLPKNVLKGYRARGEAFYQSQFMQRPIPPGGKMFKESWFNQRVKSAPYHATRCRYWDLASTEDAGCFTAGTLLAKDNKGNIYVENVEHFQCEPDERNARILATAIRDRTRYPHNPPKIYVELEGGSSGKDAFKYLQRLLSGFPVFADRPTGPKEVRAEPWASQCAALNVHLVEDGSWDLNNWMTEHTLFPLGKLKDQVDSAAAGFLRLAVLVPSNPAAFRIISIRSGSPGSRPAPMGGDSSRVALRIVVCSRAELATTPIDARSLLLCVTDPAPVGTQEVPEHGLERPLDSRLIAFGDMQPADHQEHWEDPVVPYEKPARELMMLPEHGKAIWSFVKRRRDPSWQVLVIADDNEARGLSIAYALKREYYMADIWRPKEPDWRANPKDEPPNRHIYETARDGRLMVVN
jgi:phage terminase large subunit-like protein